MHSLEDIPIGIYEKALPVDLTWDERLTAARDAGFEFIEISIDESDRRLSRLDWGADQRAALRDAISSTGVPIISMCLSGHRKYALGSASPEIRHSALDILEKAIQFAFDIGIRIIQLAGYHVYYEPRDTSTAQRYQESLYKGLEWASTAGVMLALENVDGTDVNSVTRAMEYVKEFKSPWFQVYPDIGNLSEQGLDVCAELEGGRGHIVALHVKDTRPGEVRRVPFGEGNVPFVEAFHKLAEMNFRAPMLIEMWNEDDPNAIEVVRQARKWVGERMYEGWLAAKRNK